MAGKGKARAAAAEKMYEHAKKTSKPGDGKRFAAMVKGGTSPALAAFIGRKKYGKKKFAAMSAAGRARKA